MKDYKYLLQEKTVVSNCCKACQTESTAVTVMSCAAIGIVIGCVIIGWMM